MFKILGIVSSYYPDMDEFERNIRSYLSELDSLIIWENTPAKESKIETLIQKIGDPKIEFRSTGKNEFLAYPFNETIKFAEKEGFTHILTMDQDSFFNEGHFKCFVEKVRNTVNATVAIFTPAINTNENLNDEIFPLTFAPSSGSIYPVTIFKNVGYFREDFLIYPIDVEFCFRVRKNGYIINCYSDILLNHKMGYAAKGKFGLMLNNYSAQSTYYMIRNNIILWKEYPDEISNKGKQFFIKYKIIYRALKIGFENDSLLKLKAIFMGLFHGYLGRTGSYNL